MLQNGFSSRASSIKTFLPSILKVLGMRPGKYTGFVVGLTMLLEVMLPGCFSPKETRPDYNYRPPVLESIVKREPPLSYFIDDLDAKTRDNYKTYAKEALEEAEADFNGGKCFAAWLNHQRAEAYYYLREEDPPAEFWDLGKRIEACLEKSRMSK